MEIEAIPDTGVYEKDLREFKIVKKKDETHYYVKLVNNGGRCPSCGKFIKDVIEYKPKLIRHDTHKKIHYSARRYVCECNQTFYEEDPFCEDEIDISTHCVKRILEELKRYNHTFLEVAQRFDISATKIIEIFDRHVQIQ